MQPEAKFKSKLRLSFAATVGVACPDIYMARFVASAMQSNGLPDLYFVAWNHPGTWVEAKVNDNIELRGYQSVTIPRMSRAGARVCKLHTYLTQPERGRTLNLSVYHLGKVAQQLVFPWSDLKSVSFWQTLLGVA